MAHTKNLNQSKYNEKRMQRRKKTGKFSKLLNWKQNKGKFYLNIAMGIMLALFLHLVFLHTSWGESGVNLIFDSYFTRWEAKKQVKNINNDSKIVFITISPKTSGSRGEKTQQPTPRDEIASAIEHVANDGAKIIFPDFKFESLDGQYPERDTILRKVLEEAGQKDKVSLVLPVGIERDGRLKNNIFDDLISRNPNIHRALPGIVSSNRDNPVYRYWREYEYFESQGKQEIIWGAPLLVTALMEGNTGKLEGSQKTIFRDGAKETWFYLNEEKTVRVAAKKEDRYLQRIRFSLIPQKVLGGKAASGNLGVHINISGEEVKLMPEGTFRDKIVIIGNPNPDFEDVHQTPIGMMPGMYLMGNAIKTLLDGSQITSAPLWLDICFEILIIFISAFFFIFIPVLLFKAKILRTIDNSIITNTLGLVLTVFFTFFIGYLLYLYCNVFLNAILFGFFISTYEMVYQIWELVSGLARSWKERRKKNARKTFSR